MVSFHYCKAIFYKKFWYQCVCKMRLNNFLVRIFLNEISLIIKFQLQSAIIQILESFFNTNIL